MTNSQRPQQFRKKPVTIEAVQFMPQEDDPEDLRVGPTMRALEGIGATFEDWRFAPDSIAIPTPEGTMTASPGDWIIKGVKGEFYPCKPDIFRATYEPADQRPQQPDGEPVVMWVLTYQDGDGVPDAEAWTDESEARKRLKAISEVSPLTNVQIIPVVSKADFDRVVEQRDAAQARAEQAAAEGAVLRKALSFSMVFREFTDEWHDMQNKSVVHFRELREKALDGSASAALLARLKRFEAIEQQLSDFEVLPCVNKATSWPDPPPMDKRWTDAVCRAADLVKQAMVDIARKALESEE